MNGKQPLKEKQEMMIKSQRLKSSICSPKDFSLNIVDDLMTEAIKDKYNPGRRKLSSFAKMVITSLLTVCDDLYLDEIIIPPSIATRIEKWYEIGSVETNTSNYIIMKHFLLDIYRQNILDDFYKEKDSFYSAYFVNTTVNLKSVDGKQKYFVILYEPYPMPNEEKNCFATGMCEAFQNILPKHNTLIKNIYTNVFMGSILYTNLISILNS